ncbi:MAG: hypothetical protein NT031_03385 [Planctomycetota bacterium]|nr:hypothetical protein [Planctomycetota bacterium]
MIVDIRLSHQAHPVGVDDLVCQPKGGGDLAICLALCDQLEYLPFSGDGEAMPMSS